LPLSTLISIERSFLPHRQVVSDLASRSNTVCGRREIVVATSVVWYSTIDPTMTLVYGSRMWSGPLLKNKSVEANPAAEQSKKSSSKSVMAPPSHLATSPAPTPGRHFSSAFAFLSNNSSQPSVRASEIVFDRRGSSGGLPQ